MILLLLTLAPPAAAADKAAEAARPWLTAACEAGRVRPTDPGFTLPTVSRPPSPAPFAQAVTVELDREGIRVDDQPGLDELGAAWRALDGPDHGVRLLIEHGAPRAAWGPVVEALAALPEVRVAAAVQATAPDLPEPPAPEVARTARQARAAVVGRLPAGATRFAALEQLSAELADPGRRCAPLTADLRQPLRAATDCATVVDAAVQSLALCPLDDDAVDRAATVLGVTWAREHAPALGWVVMDPEALPEGAATTWARAVGGR